MQSNRRAVIVAGKQIQDHEFLYPYYRLQEAGFDVDIAVRGKETVYGSIGVKIVPSLDIGDLFRCAPYDVLVIPGGAKAMEYMRQDEELLRFIRAFPAQDRVIACICHGAQLLISAGLVRGRRVSGYYSIKDDINNAGGIFVDAPSVVDGNLVTCPHYRHLGDWMRDTLAVVDRSSPSSLTQAEHRAGTTGIEP